MPEGIQAGLSLQEFTDLIEYLTTLQQPESTLVSNHGMPGVIPQLAKPVTARPFFSQELKLPRSEVETGLTALHQVPGLSNVFLVLHQKGMIWMMEKTATGEEKTVFADLTLQKSLAVNEAGDLSRRRINRLTEELAQLIKRVIKIEYEILQGEKGALEQEVIQEQQIIHGAGQIPFPPRTADWHHHEPRLRNL